MIFPLRVFGRSARNSSSLGAMAAPSRVRPNPMSSRRSCSFASCPGRTTTNALTTSPATGSGLPITPASATAGCSIKALSTSNGPIR